MIEWIVKKAKNTTEIPVNTVLPATSQKTIHLWKVVPKQPMVEYDFWINEKTLTFYIFPKGSQKKPFEIPATQKSQTNSKAHAKVPKSNLKPKKSKTH